MVLRKIARRLLIGFAVFMALCFVITAFNPKFGPGAEGGMSIPSLLLGFLMAVGGPLLLASSIKQPSPDDPATRPSPAANRRFILLFIGAILFFVLAMLIQFMTMVVEEAPQSAEPLEALTGSERSAQPER